MRLEWDEKKRLANLAKHGVDFAIAERIDWSTALVEADNRRKYAERRWNALTMIDSRLHSIAFAHRIGAVRVISLRKANDREVKRYDDAKDDAKI